MSTGGPAFRFACEAEDRSAPGCSARAGRLTTSHGSVETPVFMPVGTQAAVKTLAREDLLAAGAQMLLCNAYHLYLRPGVPVLEQAGGLHRFMAWDRPLLTDSGGFQVFSLAKLNKVTAAGVTFRSHIDGSEHFLTPEGVVDIQRGVGADIIMCFDECTSYPVEESVAAGSMRMTAAWAERCKARWIETGASDQQALFGIVQGSVFGGLRRESAERTVAIGFPGYAIGGVSVGEGKAEMRDAVAAAIDHLPRDAPRYLMGVGAPEDLVTFVEMGVDMFDCVMPTRNARNGSLFTSHGKINIRNSRYQTVFEPPDPACGCPVCRTYTCAYLSHLYRAGEVLALRLNTLHNLFFVLQLAVRMRDAIRAGRFAEFKRAFLSDYLG